MPSTIVRSASKTGLVLLESNVSVGTDGLVTIDTRFLAPVAGVGSQFDLDAAWPGAFALPPSTPSLQGGPYLLSKNVSKKNGLTIVQAQYVSASNPPRVAISESTEKLSFSGYAESGSLTGALAFDYYTTTKTATYTLVAPNLFRYQPSGAIGRRFNFRREGNFSLVATEEVETISTNREIVGKVTRVSVSARRVIEQGNTPAVNNPPAFLGATIASVATSNPWNIANLYGR